jgi:adenine specific DNA methylase Mod
LSNSRERKAELLQSEEDVDNSHECTAADLRETTTYGQRPEDNLLIRGDARRALPALARQPRFSWRYADQVALAYLDPPFNAGKNYRHYRDRFGPSEWLKLFRDTLVGVRDLLSETGSVWVHINDAEQHHARSVLGEVFGPKNFVATVIWDKTPGPRPNANPIAIRHEYIHVYRKSRLFTLNERLDSVWSYKDVGAGRTASAESRRLFADPFSTPKPEGLMARIIRATTAPGDIVLDCFAGSGTAAAVAHKLNRRWVAIESQEETVIGFLQPRLLRVIDGTDNVGISQEVGWTGGGGFTLAEVEPLP